MNKIHKCYNERFCEILLNLESCDDSNFDEWWAKFDYIYWNYGNVKKLTPQGPEDGKKYMNQKINGVGR
jgi:hypothetical protein